MFGNYTETILCATRGINYPLYTERVVCILHVVPSCIQPDLCPISCSVSRSYNGPDWSITALLHMGGGSTRPHISKGFAYLACEHFISSSSIHTLHINIHGYLARQQHFYVICNLLGIPENNGTSRSFYPNPMLYACICMSTSSSQKWVTYIGVNGCLCVIWLLKSRHLQYCR